MAERPIDDEALTAAFEDYYEPLRRFAYARVGRELADDVASEVFVRAVALRRRFDPEVASLRSWLFGIAANVCREQDRAWRRRTAAIRRLRAPLPTTSGTHRVDDVEVIMDALAKLRPPLREALLLVAGAELTYGEAAEALGLPVGTVASRVAAARRRLAGVSENKLESGCGSDG